MRTREVVESEILNSPSPEDLRPEAIGLITHALETDMPVYIWTVGDHGPTTNPTTGKPYPVYNFQLAKIEKSLLKRRLQDASPLLAQDPTKLDKLLVHIAPEGKINELSTIFKSLAFEGITEAYLTDDKQKKYFRCPTTS